MWKITHKRKNGTYVNDEASDIGVKWPIVELF